MSQRRDATLRAFYLPAENGQRFCLHHSPASGSLAGALIQVHAFAEEMNKSRRMVALQAREFASAGYSVLQIDLAGCGDSSGDFASADWSRWVDDVRTAMRWMVAESGQVPWLWGHRAGCLLCVDAVADDVDAEPRFLFWQPPSAGKGLLQQFRRLRAVGEALRPVEIQAGVARATGYDTAALAPEEIAGYTLSQGLSAGMERSRLRPPSAVSRSVWIEVSSREGATLLPATQRSVDEWRAAGHQVATEIVAGPAFWQTQEIETAPELLRASLSAVTSVDGAQRAKA